MIIKSKAINPKRMFTTSLFVSLLTIAATIWINIEIAGRFEAATGKTRSLFGIVELTYAYKYYLALVALMAIALGIVTVRCGMRGNGFIAIVIALIAFVSVFVRIWTFMVDRPT